MVDCIEKKCIIIIKNIRYLGEQYVPYAKRDGDYACVLAGR